MAVVFAVMVGCGGHDAPPATVDAGIVSDAEGPPDARAPIDARPATDAAPIDAPMDAGPSVDAAVVVDANLPVDAAPPIDAFVPECTSDAHCDALDGNCLVGVCTPSGTCLAVLAADGAGCDDLDACTTGDVCFAGLCDGTPLDCSVFDGQCTVGVCTAGTCESAPGHDGTVCDDANACTAGDVCAASVCAGGPPKDCSSLDGQCTVGACDIGSGACIAQPAHEGAACDDADGCTPSSTCATGVCTGVDDCSALDAECVAGICDTSTSTCTTVPFDEGAACDDGSACTIGEACVAGVCDATPYDIWDDTFADGGSGWTTQGDWEIDVATASTVTPGNGFGDPGDDHSEGDDDHLAGTVIGGNYGTGPHVTHYLTSPIVDLSGESGDVWLSYWRWLNTDYKNFVTWTVEVYDGASWVEVWNGVPCCTFVYENTWKFHEHDVSAWKNAAFRVRFGLQVGFGAFARSGMNLDDVGLRRVACGSDGICDGATMTDCSALDDACNAGVCDDVLGCLAVTVTDGTPCSDGDACTLGDACVAGACTNTGPADCSGLTTECVVGSCDSVVGCVTTPANEGLPCGPTGTCIDDGVCVSGTCSTRWVYFAEDFATTTDWTLGTEWEIDEATASTSVGFGNQDPGSDTSPTSDDKILGVVIGGTGRATTVNHAPYWAYSPIFDTSGAPGDVELRFQRYLNSDYPSFMNSKVEVWNGSSWINVFSVPPGGTYDSAWSERVYDVTAHKNASFQVRWGVEVGSAGVFSVTSWNVDDVVVADEGAVVDTACWDAF